MMVQMDVEAETWQTTIRLLLLTQMRCDPYGCFSPFMNGMQER